jgi:hypothetical protein
MLIKLNNILLHFVIMKIAAHADGVPCSPGSAYFQIEPGQLSPHQSSANFILFHHMAQSGLKKRKCLCNFTMRSIFWCCDHVICMKTKTTNNNTKNHF